MATLVQPNYIMHGFCERVIDGDTVVVDLSPAFHIKLCKLKLRLLGVNTAEMKSASARERAKAKAAQDFVRQAIEGKSILVQTVPHAKVKEITQADSFGRYLAVVYYDDKERGQVNLNEELIRLELARPYREGVTP